MGGAHPPPSRAILRAGCACLCRAELFSTAGRTGRPRALAPAHGGCTMRDEPDPPRRHRRDRRLQGVRAHAPARQGRPRGGPARHARAPSASSAPRRSRRSPGGRPNEDLYLHLTRADLLVVAPCTANTLAKLAHGLADNLLTEAALAHRGPVLVAPAMNPRMWAHPATRANAETLRRARRRARRARRGRDRRGRVGGGPDGRARRRSPRRAEQLLAPRAASRGKRVLVTAGGTREPLDAARFVGNRSSGRMGVALAEEARRRGADVVLLAANLAVPAPAGVETIPTPTAETMLDAALALADVDIALLAAAVADYRPAAAIAGKRAKSDEAVDGRARADRRHRPPLGEREAARPAARHLRRRARRGGARAQARRCSRRRTPTSSSSTTSSRADIAFESADNEVVLVVPRSASGGCRRRRRRRSRPRSSTRWSACSRDELRRTTSSRRGEAA